MTRTATRVAAAVGATAVMLALATPALACTNTDAGGRSASVSSSQAKNDPGMALHNGKHSSALTLAELQAKIDAKLDAKIAWLDAVEAKVSASDRLTDVATTAVLAHLQTSEDALTQLRADVAAATSVDGVRSVLQAADVNLFHHWFWNHGKHHDGGFFGDRDQRHGGGDRHSGGSHHGGAGSRAVPMNGRAAVAREIRPRDCGPRLGSCTKYDKVFTRVMAKDSR